MAEVVNKSLADIKAEAGRDLDSQINENTLIPAENEVGTFGVCKAFEVEKAFVKTAEEKTVAVADALAVVNADGTLSKETIASVFNHKNSLQETIPGKKTFSGGIEGNVNGNINSESSTIEELNGGVPITTAAQTLTEEQKAQVRNNIGANSILDDVVKFTPQTLTDEQKAQARENIGVKEGGGEGSSAPIGSIMMWFSPNSPAGWVFCNHTKLAISDYAELYEKLKDIPQCQSEEEGFFYTPDFREIVPVGVGENGTNDISAHDVYTLGQFKDDQFQDHSHYIYSCVNGNLDNGTKAGYQSSTKFDPESRTRNGGGTYTDSSSSLIIARNIIDGYGRHGTTTHGKQLGTNFIIKALNVTESLDESVKVDDNKTTTGNVWSGAKVAEEIGKLFTTWENITDDCIITFSGASGGSTRTDYVIYNPYLKKYRYKGTFTIGHETDRKIKIVDPKNRADMSKSFITGNMNGITRASAGLEFTTNNKTSNSVETEFYNRNSSINWDTCELSFEVDCSYTD